MRCSSGGTLSACLSLYKKSRIVPMSSGSIRVLTSFLRSSSVTCRLETSLSIESDLQQDAREGTCSGMPVAKPRNSHPVKGQQPPRQGATHAASN